MLAGYRQKVWAKRHITSFIGRGNTVHSKLYAVHSQLSSPNSLSHLHNVNLCYKDYTRGQLIRTKQSQRREEEKMAGRFREQRKREIFSTYLSYWLGTGRRKKREWNSLGCMPFPLAGGSMQNPWGRLSMLRILVREAGAVESLD